MFRQSFAGFRRAVRELMLWKRQDSQWRGAERKHHWKEKYCGLRKTAQVALFLSADLLLFHSLTLAFDTPGWLAVWIALLPSFLAAA